jgi:hypothetical protein
MFFCGAQPLFKTWFFFTDICAIFICLSLLLLITSVGRRTSSSISQSTFHVLRARHFFPSFAKTSPPAAETW